MITQTVGDLIGNLESDDVSNATQACRELEGRKSDPSYKSDHGRIKAALRAAYDRWGPNVDSWAGSE